MPLYLREWREVNDLTLERLGEKVGKHFTAIQKWEKGINKVSTEELERLAAVFGVHPSALYFHPNDRAKAERLQAAANVLDRMTPEQASTWLATGAAIAPPDGR